MHKRIFLVFVMYGLVGCNSIYVKPNSLSHNAIVYADRGGYSMRRAIKQELENRGYDVRVGHATESEMSDTDDGDIDMDTYIIPDNARYIVRVRERNPIFRPIWCSLNGFWWWRFNISIADNDSGQEVLSWFGNGCAGSSIDLLNRTLDKMEMH